VEREFRLTADGSNTLYVPSLDESYHSLYGAIQESAHVFVREGFLQVRKPKVRILETGLGTGLNVLLTLKESFSSNTTVYYHAVEKFPLDESEYGSLNYELFMDDVPENMLRTIHKVDWEKDIELTENFTLHKEKSDFRTMHPGGTFDLVYFDAFAPDKQPELWTEEIFSRIYDRLNPEGILVTYSSKSIVRKALSSCGFDVEKKAGSTR
jgi:tRNA U34 5-methylaminomethyl-2-thiouridine-forming methyltransferase MnmC